jgi:hypothetical protein
MASCNSGCTDNKCETCPSNKDTCTDCEDGYKVIDADCFGKYTVYLGLILIVSAKYNREVWQISMPDAIVYIIEKKSVWKMFYMKIFFHSFEKLNKHNIYRGIFISF